MNISEPKNNNYAAVVVSIKNIIPLDNCDNVVATTLFGFQAIVTKDTKVGDIGIMFPAECQLSEAYCYENNLFRHTEKNKNKHEKGYIEDTRRVQALKFRGHRSDCLFMPISSLAWVGINLEDLKENMTFDTLEGQEICRKYVIQVPEPRVHIQTKRVFKRYDEKFIPEHIDSDHYLRVEHEIKDSETIIVTQKLHGTSIRVANTLVKRQLNIIERLLKKMGVKIQQTEFDYVYGSRKVIKDPKNKDQKHYYETDIWTKEGSRLLGLLPENFVVYGELIGFTPTGAPIQQNYTYNLAPGQCKLYVYRISFVNGQGIPTDLSWDQVKIMCKNIGVDFVPELWRGKKKNLKLSKYIDTVLSKTYSCVSLSDPSSVDEGICIRVEGLTPRIMKAKSPIFLQHETTLLSQQVEDIESLQSDI